MSDQPLPSKVLIIDADNSICGTLSEPLDKVGVELFSAGDLQTALYRFNKQFFRVVFIEHHFPELSALALIQKFRQHEMQEKQTAGFVVMVNSSLKKQEEALIKEMGHITIVQKPLKFATFISQIQKVYRAHEKHSLSQKVKKEIVDELKLSNDFGAAIAAIKNHQSDLGDEYLPLLMHLYETNGNYKEGLDALKKIPENSMNPLKKLNMMGRFCLKLGEFEQAREHFEKAHEIAPDNLERMDNLTDAYLELDEPESAVGLQKKVLDLNPDEPDLKFDMFKKLENHGYDDYAKDFCQETTSPTEVVRYFNNKGVAMAHSSTPMEAIEEYQRALNYYPENKLNYRIHFNIGLAYLRCKKKSLLPKAIESLEASIQMKNDYAKAIELLNKIQKKAG